MSLKSLSEKAGYVWKRIRRVPTSNGDVVLHEDDAKPSQTGRERSYSEMKKWMPNLYINSSDYICCCYTNLASSSAAPDEGKDSNKGTREVAAAKLFVLSKGDFADEASATTESDIEETLKRLIVQLKKSPEEVFDALKNQTVDLVFTAHPTQSIRRTLLQKHARGPQEGGGEEASLGWWRRRPQEGGEVSLGWRRPQEGGGEAL